MGKKWYEALDADDVAFLQQLAAADFKLSRLSAQNGSSYFVLKKKVSKLKQALGQEEKEDTDFKEYLELLVAEKILPSSIAQVLYQKYLEGVRKK